MNVFFRYNQMLPLKINLSVRANWYKAPESGLYSWGRYSGWTNVLYWIDVRRAFLQDDRLNVGLTLQTPFHYSRPGWISYTELDNYYGKTFSERFNNFKVYLNVSYRFGSFKASVKKVRSVASDDVVGGNRQE